MRPNNAKFLTGFKPPQIISSGKNLHPMSFKSFITLLLTSGGDKTTTVCPSEIKASISERRKFTTFQAALTVIMICIIFVVENQSLRIYIDKFYHIIFYNNYMISM